jgi:hypothetical protein
MPGYHPFHVDTVLLRRPYALFSIELDGRRVKAFGITANPDPAQVGRTVELGGLGH